jgi:hypothetical protein
MFGKGEQWVGTRRRRGVRPWRRTGRLSDKRTTALGVTDASSACRFGRYWRAESCIDRKIEAVPLVELANLGNL